VVLRKNRLHSELIDWLKLLSADDILLSVLQDNDAKNAAPPLYGALLKK